MLRHWGRVLEAVTELTLASLRLQLGRLTGRGSSLGDLRREAAAGPADPAQLCEARRVSFAVMRATRWLPWHPTCLRQAIATQRMLRRRRIASRLELGVNRTTAGEAHAWVTVQGEPVIGHHELESFVPLAGFE
jgi:transglutaminase superfamily protein